MCLCRHSLKKPFLSVLLNIVHLVEVAKKQILEIKNKSIFPLIVQPEEKLLKTFCSVISPLKLTLSVMSFALP